jgi:putative SOS response-associated peptidase YedK
MCYSAVSITRQLVKYAKHRSDDKNKIEELEKQLQLIVTSQHKFYFADAYAHPRLLVFTNKEPFKPQLFYWGLIPNWIKSKSDALKIANQTLNARSETIFEKPAFKQSAKNKRCLIFLDAFYEYHHYNNNTFPFHISHIHNEPLTIAGIWEEWPDPDTGELIPTVSIVTTKANSLLKKIHNTPKQTEARMPVILKREDQDKWLEQTDEKDLFSLLVPYDAHLLKAHTVRKLKGKGATGNTTEAEKEFTYLELANF